MVPTFKCTTVREVNILLAIMVSFLKWSIVCTCFNESRLPDDFQRYRQTLNEPIWKSLLYTGGGIALSNGLFGRSSVLMRQCHDGCSTLNYWSIFAIRPLLTAGVRTVSYPNHTFPGQA